MRSGRITWTIGELAEVLRKRQLNKFDVNIGVSGRRGNGKSTFINKLLLRFKNDGFNQKKQQVYDREDVIELLATQKFGYCWDDEAINSGFKRDFQSSGVKDLIKIITNYRDNYNLYISALPFFYSLDKALRELIFLHVHIIERGVGVLLMPIGDSIHGTDPWDSKTNEKVEEKEKALMMKNPNHKFRYHKLTTFAGYVYFNDLTDLQKELYSEVKQKKREERFQMEESLRIKKEEAGKRESLLDGGVYVKDPFMKECYELVANGKITVEELKKKCIDAGKRYTYIKKEVNNLLVDTGKPTYKVLMETYEIKANKSKEDELKDLLGF